MATCRPYRYAQSKLDQQVGRTYTLDFIDRTMSVVGKLWDQLLFLKVHLC